MVLNATFYTSSSAIIIVSDILFAFVIFNDEYSNELSSDVELNASFFQLLNWNRLKFNVTLLLFHRKNCKMKPVNNKSNVNPLSFWHRLPPKYFSLEFILHQFHQHDQKKEFKNPENAIKLVAETTAIITRRCNNDNNTHSNKCDTHCSCFDASRLCQPLAYAIHFNFTIFFRCFCL